MAAQRGQSATDYAAQLLAEALEDALDVMEADRIMESSDPTEWRSLDELRTAVFEKQAGVSLETSP